MGKVKFTFRVDEKLLEQMKIFAIITGKPLNEILEEAYKNYFDSYNNSLIGGEKNE